jgi:methionyl aminopeptidase
MVYLKTPDEISFIRESGKILAAVLREVAGMVRPGVSTAALEACAEEKIHALGGVPSFKGYRASPNEQPFPTAMCISINSEVVHAPALPSRVLREGDVVGLDCGVRYKGWCSDMAVTVGVGNISHQAQKLIKVTQEALRRGLAAVKPGALLSGIGGVIQPYVESQGFNVVRDLVGHGIGREPHEEPRIYNFVEPRQPKIILEQGMVLCLEPMVNAGSWRVKTLEDGWTIATLDGSLAAHFEHTVAVTKEGFEVLTK